MRTKHPPLGFGLTLLACFWSIGQCAGLSLSLQHHLQIIKSANLSELINGSAIHADYKIYGKVMLARHPTDFTEVVLTPFGESIQKQSSKGDGFWTTASVLCSLMDYHFRYFYMNYPATDVFGIRFFSSLFLNGGNREVQVEIIKAIMFEQLDENRAYVVLCPQSISANQQTVWDAVGSARRQMQFAYHPYLTQEGKQIMKRLKHLNVAPSYILPEFKPLIKEVMSWPKDFRASRWVSAEMIYGLSKKDSMHKLKAAVFFNAIAVSANVEADKMLTAIVKSLKEHIRNGPYDLVMNKFHADIIEVSFDYVKQNYKTMKDNDPDLLIFFIDNFVATKFKNIKQTLLENILKQLNVPLENYALIETKITKATSLQSLFGDVEELFAAKRRNIELQEFLSVQEIAPRRSSSRLASLQSRHLHRPVRHEFIKVLLLTIGLILIYRLLVYLSFNLAASLFPNVVLQSGCISDSLSIEFEGLRFRILGMCLDDEPPNK